MRERVEVLKGVGLHAGRLRDGRALHEAADEFLELFLGEGDLLV